MSRRFSFTTMVSDGQDVERRDHDDEAEHDAVHDLLELERREEVAIHLHPVARPVRESAERRLDPPRAVSRAP